MRQSINTIPEAACLKAAPAFQLPAARARPAAGPGGHSPAAAPGARPACLASPDPKHCAVGWRWAAAMAYILGYAASSLQHAPWHAHPDPARIRGRAGGTARRDFRGCELPAPRPWGYRCGWGETHARAMTRPGRGRATAAPHAGRRTHIRVWPAAPAGKARPNRVSHAGC